VADGRRAGGRLLALAVLAGLASGGLAFAAARRPWATVEVATEGLPRVVIETVGTSVVPWAGALALVVVTGSLALLPTGGRVRQVVAAVVMLAALGVFLGCAFAGGALSEQVAEDVSASSVSTGLAPAADHSPWRWAAVAAGVVGVGVGAWALTRSADWPVMGSRYEAPVPTAGPRPRPDADEAAETDLWRAMDRGDDPT
jgi:uncharacterized membrane protein (TIGR02234 family)